MESAGSLAGAGRARPRRVRAGGRRHRRPTRCADRRTLAARADGALRALRRGRARRWPSGARRPAARDRRCSPARGRSAPASNGPSTSCERALDQHGAPVYVRKQIVHNTHVVAELEAAARCSCDELDEVPDGRHRRVLRARRVARRSGRRPPAGPRCDRRDLPAGRQGAHRGAPVRRTRRHRRAHRPRRPRGDRGHRCGEAPDRIVAGAGRAADADRARGAPTRTGSSYLTQTTLAVDEAAEVVERAARAVPRARRARPRRHLLRHHQPPAGGARRRRGVRPRARGRLGQLVQLATGSSRSPERAGAPAHLVDDAASIDLAWLAGRTTVGVTAGASAPRVAGRRGRRRAARASVRSTSPSTRSPTRTSSSRLPEGGARLMAMPAAAEPARRPLPDAQQKLRGREKFPLLVELEPLFACNLACAGLRQDPAPDRRSSASSGCRSSRRVGGDRGVRRADGARSPAASR